MQYRGAKGEGDPRESPIRDKLVERLADEEELAIGEQYIDYDVPRDEVLSFRRDFWLFNSEMRKKGVVLGWEYATKWFKRGGGLPDIVRVYKESTSNGS